MALDVNTRYCKNKQSILLENSFKNTSLKTWKEYQNFGCSFHVKIWFQQHWFLSDKSRFCPEGSLSEACVCLSFSIYHPESCLRILFQSIRLSFTKTLTPYTSSCALFQGWELWRTESAKVAFLSTTHKEKNTASPLHWWVMTRNGLDACSDLREK